MEKLTINKSNWSGEETEITIYANGDLGLDSVRYRCEKSEEPMEDATPGDRYSVFEQALFFHPGDSEFPIAKAAKFNHEKYWEATDDDFINGITRDDQNLHVAVAQILCNIL